jgi:hypothetical protein
VYRALGLPIAQSSVAEVLHTLSNGYVFPGQGHFARHGGDSDKDYAEFVRITRRSVKLIVEAPAQALNHNASSCRSSHHRKDAGDRAQTRTSGSDAPPSAGAVHSEQCEDATGRLLSANDPEQAPGGEDQRDRLDRCEPSGIRGIR